MLKTLTKIADRASKAFVSLFGAGSIHRTNKNWLPSLKSGIEEDLDMSKLFGVGRCRDISKSDYVNGAVKREKINVVQDGIRVKYKDKSINELYQLWSSVPSFCDLYGINSITGMAKIILSQLETDGEIFVRRHYLPSSKHPIKLCLELIELDSISTLHDNGTTIRNGIKYDSNGRPEMYYFYSDDNAGEIEVIAKDVIHIFNQERASSVRGTPGLESVALAYKDTKDYQAYEAIAAKIHASIGFFLESDIPESFTDEESFPDFIEPGKIITLPGGMKFTNSGQQRPGGSYQPYLQTMLQGLSAGLNQAYPNVTQDYTSSSFASARMATIEERSVFREKQRFLRDRFYKPVCVWFLETGKITGDVGCQKGLDIFKTVYIENKYLFPGYDWVDPYKDARAVQCLIDSKLITWEQALAIRQLDYDETVERMKIEASDIEDIEKLRGAK